VPQVALSEPLSEATCAIPSIRLTQAPSTERHDVGELAQRLFPGGVLARFQPWFIREALQRTQQLLDGGESVLYEPAFQHDGVMAYVDILAAWRRGLAPVRSEESSTGVKEVYLADAGIQTPSCAERAGPGGCFHHPSQQPVRAQRELIQQLFTVASVLPECGSDAGCHGGAGCRTEGRARGGQVPPIDIGPTAPNPTPAIS
jgi:hypothetical protein